MKNPQYQKRQEARESSLWQQYDNLTNKELISLLDDDDAMKRRIAASFLQLNGGSEVIQLAKLYCLNTSYKYRAEGAFILGQVKLSSEEEKKVMDLLHKLALHDKSAWVRDNAVASMGHRCNRNNKFTLMLIQQSLITMQDKSPHVRLNTAFSLSCVNDESSIPILLKLLKDPNGNVRNWAAFAVNLNEYNSSEIRDCLANMLSDSHSEARFEAIVGLAKRQDKRVTETLAYELKKNIAYDDFVEAAGELGDIALLPILNEMINRFGEFDKLNLSIEKLKKLKRSPN